LMEQFNSFFSDGGLRGLIESSSTKVRFVWIWLPNKLTFKYQMATLMFWIELFCVSWNARKLNYSSSNHDEWFK
jgi:hypothetical protein